MINILIPVDFSPVSVQAAEYAIRLSQKAEAITFTFYHTYFLADIEKAKADLATDAENDMNDFIETITTDHRDMDYRVIVNDRQLLVGVQEIIEKQHIDMIVMGINGKGRLSQKIFGSNTLALVHKTQVPVLVIPEDVQSEDIETLMMAVPYKDGLLELIPVDGIKKLVEGLKLKLKIVTVNKNTSAFETLNILTDQTILLEHFEALHPEYYKLDGKHIAQSLIEFAQAENAQWICTVAEEHGLWQRLLGGSVTTELAYNSTKPILIFSAQHS